MNNLTNISTTNALVEAEKFDKLRYFIIPFKNVDYSKAIKYWKTIVDADLIQDRLGNIKDPGIDDVSMMLRDNFLYEHFIVDLQTSEIIGEFLVTQISGKVGTLHFSAHPEVPFARAVSIGKMATDAVLNEWKDGYALDQPYLTSLIGLTPAENRRACIYVLRTGFKRVMNIANGCHYQGELAAAMLSIKNKL